MRKNDAGCGRGLPVDVTNIAELVPIPERVPKVVYRKANHCFPIGIKHMEGIQQSREREDRRTFSWHTVFFGFLRSRRRDQRRGTEAESLYSDWHHPWLFFLSIGTMILSCMDAFFTLQLIERGFVEINPVMDAVIGHSALTFTVSKMLLTGFGILTLVFLSRARFMNRLRTGLILTIFFSFYCCLVCYEFVFLLTHF